MLRTSRHRPTGRRDRIRRDRKSGKPTQNGPMTLAKTTWFRLGITTGRSRHIAAGLFKQGKTAPVTDGYRNLQHKQSKHHRMFFQSRDTARPKDESTERRTQKTQLPIGPHKATGHRLQVAPAGPAKYWHFTPTTAARRIPTRKSLYCRNPGIFRQPKAANKLNQP